MAEMTHDKIKHESKEMAVGPWQLAWGRFKKNKVAIAGAILFIIIVLFVTIYPLVSPYQMSEFSLDNKSLSPSSEHLLGTDEQGRDVLLRIALGGRVSILVGLLAASVTVILGSVVGGISGYYGGWVDNFLMRFAEIVYSIPFYPTVISISAALMFRSTSTNKILIVMFLIGILSWPGLARIVRGQILSLREQELPNVLPYIIVNATLSMAGAILTEASLSFIGLGVAPPTPTWGNMVERARNTRVFNSYHWMWLPPGMMIMLTVVSINLLGEGLRDALDPKGSR